MNYALALAIFGSGIVVGIALFILASLTGQWLAERLERYPLVEEEKDNVVKLEGLRWSR